MNAGPFHSSNALRFAAYMHSVTKSKQSLILEYSKVAFFITQIRANLVNRNVKAANVWDLWLSLH